MDATIKSAFWSDPRIEELDAAGKLAALWLVTNSQRDLLGFTRSTPRRFSFETGLDPHHIEAPCHTLPTSFQAPSEGVYFAVNFLRHQFGQGGQLSLNNNVIKAAIRKAKTLPSPLQDAFLRAYPELTKAVREKRPDAADAEAPSKPLGRDQSSAEQSMAEHKPEGEPERETTAGDRKLAEKLVAACPRPDLTIKAINAALKCLIRHRGAYTFEEILEAVEASTKAVKEWPEDERVTYTPEASRYFGDDLWRKAPESWQSRRQARKQAKQHDGATLQTGSGRTFEVLTLEDPQ